MDNTTRASTSTKSILKPKSKSSSGNPLRASASTPTKSYQKKKKVEITTPPHSVKSDEIQGGKKYIRETPIPRVAFVSSLNYFILLRLLTHCKTP